MPISILYKQPWSTRLTVKLWTSTGGCKFFLNTSDNLSRQTFGFRSVSWTDRQILINDKPFYCLGFGMHEDSEIHGRGFDPVIMTKDLNLLEWMGGNCYRTTHYPYAEERMYENDRRGIVVVAETPAVGLKGFPKNNQLLHLQMLEELVTRDRNHPSIIMWSLANEPQTMKKESRQYFKGLVDYAHAIDPTRPVTIVYGPTNFDNDQTVSISFFLEKMNQKGTETKLSRRT